MEELSQPRPFEALGRAVALRRTQLGLKRRDLAARAELSYPYISEIENGLKQPSGTALTRIAEALDFDRSELLGLSETLEHQSHSREPRPPDGTFRDSLQMLGLGTGDAGGTPTHAATSPDPSKEETDQVGELIRAEIRRELDSWAAYRLPELIRREVRRIAPTLPDEPNE